MKIYHAIAEAFEAEGCDTIFGLMGDGNMWLWATLVERGRTRFISSRHENASVAMADGYARASGRLGVATVTCGPGLTQVGTALTTASRNCTPLLLAIGEAATGSTAQWMNQRQFAEACGARYHTITSGRELAREVAAAFYAARVHACPVVLNLPIWTQEEELVDAWSYRASTSFLPLPPSAPRDEEVMVIVDALAAAKKPVIVAGRGARLAAAADEIAEVGERVGALLATTLLGKDLFADQPYNIGVAGGYANAPAEVLLPEADFVLGVGAELGYFTTQGNRLFPRAQFARIDLKPASDVFGYTPGLYVRGDARLVLRRINEMLAERQVRSQGYRTAETREVLEAPVPAAPVSTAGLDPRRLMKSLSGALPSGVVTTFGVGHFLPFASAYLTLPQDAEMNVPIQFGAVGQALACAIGAAIALPHRCHVAVEGDGGVLMELQELETVVRHGLSLILIICNDSGYGAEVHKLRAYGFDGQLATWSTPDFIAVARALGGEGVRLESEDAIGDAVEEGRRRGSLFVIDAPVAPDVLNDPVRRLFGLPNLAPVIRRPPLAD